MKTLRERVLAQIFTKVNKFILVNAYNHQLFFQLYSFQYQLRKEDAFGHLEAKNGCDTINANLSWHESVFLVVVLLYWGFVLFPTLSSFHCEIPKNITDLVFFDHIPYIRRSILI